MTTARLPSDVAASAVVDDTCTPALVSTIVVNYNSGGYLSVALGAVLGSTAPIEVIVVDNGSHDHSLEEAKRQHGGDPRVTILHNRRNLGFARASNRGMRRARGHYLLLLNPDCLVLPDTVARMTRYMEANPGVGLAGCVVRNPDGTEQTGSRRATPTPWRSLLRMLRLDRFVSARMDVDGYCRVGDPLPAHPVEVEAISGAFMFARRSAVRTVGVLDKGYFLHCEDLDWCMRFRLAGWRLLFVPDVDVLHYKGVCSTAEPVAVLWHKHRGMIRFYNKFFLHQYSWLLMVLVKTAVWCRLGLLVAWQSLRQFVRLLMPRRGASVAATMPSLDPRWRAVAGTPGSQGRPCGERVDST